VTQAGPDGETKLCKLTHNATPSFGQIEQTTAALRISMFPFVNYGVWAFNPTTNGGTRQFELKVFETGASRSVAANFACPNDGEWHFCVVPKLHTTTNSVTAGDTARYMRVTQGSSVHAWTTGEYMLFGRGYYNTKTRAKFIICTDDGVVSNITDGTGFPTDYPASGGNYLDICTAYGFEATAFIIPGLVGTAGYMTWAQIGTLRDAGWSICNHANEDVGDASSRGMTLLGPFGLALGAGANDFFAQAANDDSAIYENIVLGRDALAAQGYGNGSTLFALPQGGWDDYVISAARRAGMRTIVGISNHDQAAIGPQGDRTGGATVNGTGLSTLLVAGYQDITSRVQIDGAPTLANITAYIDRLCETGGTGGCYTHGLTAATATKFDGMCAHLKMRVRQGLIDAVTLEEWKRGLSGARVAA
jgi:hypothetical protein